MAPRKGRPPKAPPVTRYCLHCGAMIRPSNDMEKWLLGVLTTVACIECQPDGGWPIE